MPPLTLLEWGILVVAAFVTSIISAVAGVGGGAALVGIMAGVLPGVAVVPVHGVVQFAANFTRVVAFFSRVNWGLYARVGPGLVVGGLLAREVLMHFIAAGELTFLRVVVGGFLFVFLLLRRFSPSVRTPPRWIYFPVAVVVGLVGMFVGALGPFLAPFLLRDDLEKEEVIATSAICMGTGHLLKIPVYLSLGFRFFDWIALIGACTGAVVVGTFVGKRLLAKFDQKRFIRVVETMLFVLAVWLCGGWVWSTFFAAH